MIKKVRVSGRIIEYDLQIKKVKNINLRIRSDGSVGISANKRVPEAYIEAFVISNADKVLRAIDRYNKLKESAAKPTEYNDGDSVQVLGIELKIRLTEASGRSRAHLENGEVVVCVSDKGDREAKAAAVDRLLREMCRSAVADSLERLFPLLEGRGIEKPVLKFRKMTRKWGICRPARKEITFAYMLASVPLHCIDYVVMHELVHLIHPDHSRAFYSCLENFMPDWQIRKKKLEGNALQ